MVALVPVAKVAGRALVHAKLTSTNCGCKDAPTLAELFAGLLSRVSVLLCVIGPALIEKLPVEDPPLFIVMEQEIVTPPELLEGYLPGGRNQDAIPPTVPVAMLGQVVDVMEAAAPPVLVNEMGTYTRMAPNEFCGALTLSK